MRFYVSADIEGIANVVARDQMRPGGHEYEAACAWMTRSVVAVCQAAHAHGATELVVSDSHGNGMNVDPDALPNYVRLVRSWPRPLGMMQGIEGGRFDGAFLIGYHTGSSNLEGVLAHTMSSDLIHEVRLGGKIASEAVISAAIAGAYGVPVLMVAGDHATVDETRAMLGPIAAATLKQAYGSYSAISPTPSTALDLLAKATGEAVALAGEIKPYRLPEPIDLEIALRTRFVAEWLSYLPEIERPDAYTIRYRAADASALSKFLMFLTTARMALAA
jgi:D-amino peptidase